MPVEYTDGNLARPCEEDVLSLDKLGASGLVTFPSPLLGPLLVDLPAVLEREVLSRQGDYCDSN